MTIDIRPRADAAVLDRHLDLIELLNGPFGPLLKRPRSPVIPSTSSTKGTDFLIELEVAGIDKTKDVTVRSEGGRVVIDIDKRPPGRKPPLGDRRYGFWTRAFRPPFRVDMTGETRDYDLGVLRITIPKA
jgi:HSP20 family molecular chaperone IbpA